MPRRVDADATPLLMLMLLMRADARRYFRFLRCFSRADYFFSILIFSILLPFAMSLPDAMMLYAGGFLFID